MCGRFTLSRSPAEVAEAFALPDVPALAPRYNIAPTQEVAAVRELEPDRRSLALLRWGLIPHWASDAAIGQRMINARVETAGERPAFRSLLSRRRCILPADGFYEWGGGGRQRQPYWVGLPGGGLFGMAGLWDVWRDPAGATVESCTVLTTGSHGPLRRIHDRMPLILEPGQVAPWLDPSRNAAALGPILAGAGPPQLELRPVGFGVNDPRNDGPDCLEPAPGLLF